MSAATIRVETCSSPGVLYSLIVAQTIVVLYSVIYSACRPESRPWVNSTLIVLTPCLGSNIFGIFYDEAIWVMLTVQCLTNAFTMVVLLARRSRIWMIPVGYQLVGFGFQVWGYAGTLSTILYIGFLLGRMALLATFVLLLCYEHFTIPAFIASFCAFISCAVGAFGISQREHKLAILALGQIELLIFFTLLLLYSDDTINSLVRTVYNGCQIFSRRTTNSVLNKEHVRKLAAATLKIVHVSAVQGTEKEPLLTKDKKLRFLGYQVTEKDIA